MLPSLRRAVTVTWVAALLVGLPAAAFAGSSPGTTTTRAPGGHPAPASRAPVLLGAVRHLASPQGAAGPAPAVAAGTGLITRAGILTRAASWVDSRPNVPYGQTTHFVSPSDYYGDGRGDDPADGWREDCSGFVSYTWDLPAPGMDSFTLPEVSTPISKALLQPGDILIANWSATQGHAALVTGWYDAAHTAVNIDEESDPEDGGTRVLLDQPVYTGYWGEFTAYRYDNLESAAAGVSIAQPVAGQQDIVGVGSNGELYWNHDATDTGPWSGWQQVDAGQFEGRPSAVSAQPGELDVFVRGTDGSLQYDSYQYSTGAWAGWLDLGGTLASDPVAVSPGPGQLDVFGVGTDGRLYQDAYPSPTAAGQWTGWTAMPDGAFQGRPSVVSWQPGRIDVFVRGSDGALEHDWWQSGDTSWPAWQDLGGVLVSDPSAVSTGPGSLDVYGVGTDGRIYQQAYPDPGHAPLWTGWVALPWGAFVGDPAAVASAGGRVDVFGIGPDTELYQNFTEPGIGWAAVWYRRYGSAISDPAAAGTGGGALEVFVVGTDQQPYQTTSPDGLTWSPWQGLGGAIE